MAGLNGRNGFMRVLCMKCLLWHAVLIAGAVVAEPLPVFLNDEGRLEYALYAARGEETARHRLPDFSFAGYRGGGVAIPNVREVARLAPSGGDDTARIQEALDDAARWPLDSEGFRGAVVLERGTFILSDALYVRTSGVVLRGSGQDALGTILQADGPRSVILLGGGNNPFPPEPAGDVFRVRSDFVPAGARANIEVEGLRRSGIRPGQRIGIRMTRNQAWVDSLDMAQYGWTPEFYSIVHLRTVTGVEGDRLFIDIPLVDVIREEHGGAEVFLVEEPEQMVTQAGVEHLRIISGDPEDDGEERPWNAIVVSGLRDGWVRNISALHFPYSTVSMRRAVSRITVEDCAYLDPRGLVTGGRRYSFVLSYGADQILMQRCYSIRSRHDYVTHSRVTGPSAFVDVLADHSFTDCGPHHRWASGILYDNLLSTNMLNVENRGPSGTGHGWTGVQHVFWNCEASRSRLYTPPGHMNFCFGFVGQEIDSTIEPDSSRGRRELRGQFIEPRSLYFQQLADRLGAEAVAAVTDPRQREGRIIEALKQWGGCDAFQPSPLVDDLPQARVDGGTIILEVFPRDGAAIRSFEWVEQLADGSYRPAGSESPALVLDRAAFASGSRRFFCRIVTERGPYWSQQLTIHDGGAVELPLASGDVVTGLSMHATHLGWLTYLEGDDAANLIGAFGPGNNIRHANPILRFDLPFSAGGTLQRATLRIDRNIELDQAGLMSADLYGLDPRAGGFTKIGGTLWHQGNPDQRPFVLFFKPSVVVKSDEGSAIEVDVTDYVRQLYDGPQPLVQTIYFRLSPSEAREIEQRGRLAIHNQPVPDEKTGLRPPVLQLQF